MKTARNQAIIVLNADELRQALAMAEKTKFPIIARMEKITDGDCIQFSLLDIRTAKGER